MRDLSESQGMHLYIEFELGVEGALVGDRLSEAPLTGELRKASCQQM
jgi:hypothetical protein